MTNEKGEFRFTGIDYNDTTIFFIQARNPRGINEDVNVTIDDEDFPSIADNQSRVESIAIETSR
jgi:hypothetical protein